MTLREWLTPPAAGTDPRATLGWVRRMEMASGIVSIVLGVVFWNEGWWSWALLAIGAVGVSPWGGAASLLRKADRDPTVFERDPERGRARARRVALILPPVYVAAAVLAGYLVEGLRAAVVMGVVVGVGAVLGSVLVRRRYR